MPLGNPQFGVDVNDVDSRGNRILKIAVLCAGAAVQGEKATGSLLDLADALHVQPFLRLPLQHCLQHAMPVAYRGRQDVDPSAFVGIRTLTVVVR